MLRIFVRLCKWCVELKWHREDDWQQTEEQRLCVAAYIKIYNIKTFKIFDFFISQTIKDPVTFGEKETKPSYRP